VKAGGKRDNTLRVLIVRVLTVVLQGGNLQGNGNVKQLTHLLLGNVWFC
jgi:hypothetical protein